jgi:hypothetical protein
MYQEVGVEEFVEWEQFWGPKERRSGIEPVNKQTGMLTFKLAVLSLEEDIRKGK